MKMTNQFIRMVLGSPPRIAAGSCLTKFSDRFPLHTVKIRKPHNILGESCTSSLSKIQKI